MGKLKKLLLSLLNLPLQICGFFTPHFFSHHHDSTAVSLACGTTNQNVIVVDNIINVNNCERISNWIYSVDLKFTVFDRRNPRNCTVLETLIDSILTEFKDDSAFVEYWWGRQWISHDLHRDVDEHLCREQRVLRYPKKGHVLYLFCDQDSLGGQTIVISDKVDYSSNDGYKMHSIYVVPPYPGRLLRFDGHLLHGVPRPELEYFLYDQSLEDLFPSLPIDKSKSETEAHSTDRFDNLTQFCDRQREDKENEDSMRSLRRCVLLFNTWANEPPRNARYSDSDDALNPQSLSELSITSPVEWRKAEFTHCCENASQVHSDIRNIEGLRMRMKLPRDRLRRDSYSSTLTLATSKYAHNAFIVSRVPTKSPQPKQILAWEDSDEE